MSLRFIQVGYASIVTQCPTVGNPMDCSPLASSVHRIFQARILEWVPFPPPGDLPNPGNEHVSCVFCTAGRFFTHWAIKEAAHIKIFFLFKGEYIYIYIYIYTYIYTHTQMNVFMYLYTYIIFLFIHSSIYRHMGRFYILAVIKSYCCEHGYTNISLRPCFPFYWVYTQNWKCWIIW